MLGSAADRAAEKLWGEGATAELLVGRAEEGDAQAIEALAEIGRLLGAGIGSFVNIFYPELVVVGGGFGVAAGEFLLHRPTRSLRREALEPARCGPPDRRRPSSAHDAGLIGAGLARPSRRSLDDS